MAAKEAGDVIGSDDFLDIFGVAWIGLWIIMSWLVGFSSASIDMDHIITHTGGKEFPKVVVAVSRKEQFKYLRETDVTIIILPISQSLIIIEFIISKILIPLFHIFSPNTCHLWE